MDDVWTTKDVVQTAAAVFQGLGSFSIFAAIFIYRHQRRTALVSERQTNRSRLTEAYMRWHWTILNNEKNIIAATEVLRRYIRLDETHNIEQYTRAIHVVYMALNVLFLDWNYRTAYNLPMTDLHVTIDSMLRGLATNPHPIYGRLVDNFREIFFDFPPAFKDMIWNQLVKFRAEAARRAS